MCPSYQWVVVCDWFVGIVKVVLVYSFLLCGSHSLQPISATYAFPVWRGNEVYVSDMWAWVTVN